MNCSRCGQDSERRIYNDTFDPDAERKLFFYLCPDCRREFFRLTEGFLEARE